MFDHKHGSHIRLSDLFRPPSVLMSAEFDDVLTNQPVVIDNVRVLSFDTLITMMLIPLSRALEPSRPALLDRTTPNVFSRLCAS